MTKQYNFIDPKVLPLRARFVEAFSIDPQTRANIVESILKNGWDKDQEIILARIPNAPPFMIDGHSRREAAIEAGLARVTYIVKDFDSEDDAFEYIQGLQFNRRNLSDRDKILLIQKAAGYESAANKKTFIARVLHISERSAAKYMSILKDPERLRLVMDDRETVNSVQAVKGAKESEVEGIKKKIQKMGVAELDELEKAIKRIKKELKRGGQNEI